MEPFRFAIMGAGNIAGKFCEAVKLAEGCQVAAVASKSAQRAEAFAAKHGIPASYEGYARMLKETKPDCVYIAATCDAHYELSKLCLEHGVPVLCEKAMFLNSAQAEEIFAISEKNGIFVMEAMWSRFLPAVKRAKEWIRQGRIGKPVLAQIDIGFRAPQDADNRYMNPALGGGAAFDLTVYTYELADFFIEQKAQEMQVSAMWSASGVDVTDTVLVRYDSAMAVLTSSFMTGLEEKAVIYGEKGRIVLPKPHFASQTILECQGLQPELEEGERLMPDGRLLYMDEVTKNGFVYEIQETIRCVREGRTESQVVPHALTLSCARLFDRIMETRPR